MRKEYSPYKRVKYEKITERDMLHLRNPPKPLKIIVPVVIKEIMEDKIKLKEVAAQIIDSIVSYDESGDIIDCIDDACKILKFPTGNVAKFEMVKWMNGDRINPPRGKIIYTVTVEAKYIPFDDE